MTEFLPVLMLLIGLAVGAGFVLVLMRSTGRHEYDRGKRDAEAERAALTERLDARQQSIDELNTSVRELEGQVRGLQATETSLKTEAAQLTTKLEVELIE